LCGIVGKPNVGKSTFFSAATLAAVEVANYPFTTIKPNKGIGYIRTQCVCKEFNVKDNPVNSVCLDGTRLIPVKLIDCAGLVPDAWKGRGLGNQFLSEICNADVLIHVLDASGSTDLEGRPVNPGSHDPVKDVKFLERELTMWFAQILKKNWSKIARTTESNNAELSTLLEEKLSGLGIKRRHIIESIRKTGLKQDKPTKWNNEEFIKFIDVLRNISKPMLIAANKIDLPSAIQNLNRLKDLGYKVIPCCSEAELVLRRAAEKNLIKYTPGNQKFDISEPKKISEVQRKALNIIKKKVLNFFGTTGVQESLNTSFFKLLNMITVFTVEDHEKLSDHNGRILPDARLVQHGITARELAYKIHTDLGENFIYAINAKTKRREGENYILKNKDVISIISAKKRR
jgi:ribosome-binding ATPase YchF (GTP1/OBG family)